MNAIDLLDTQHKEVTALFKKCEKAEGEEKQRLFEKIADDLAVHAAIEEHHFYPATKAARTEDLLHEAVEEHLAVKRVLADMLEMDVDDPQFAAKLTLLIEQVEHHVDEERKELFPKVKKLLSADELEDLGVVMEDMANELKAGGSPRQSIPAETGHAAPI